MGQRFINEVLAAIGRSLRAEYDLTEPIPARLADLLRQLGPDESELPGAKGMEHTTVEQLARLGEPGHEHTYQQQA